MSEKVKLLDKALEMSELELELLAEGDVERAETASEERADLIRRILSMEDDAGSEEVLMDKLVQLKQIQSRLTGEARRLHEELKQDLIRAKQETRRYGGYQEAAGGRAVHSKFISKRS